MPKIVADAVGIFPYPVALSDRRGTGSLPLQAVVPAGGSATFRLLGRVSADAPWVEVRAPASAGFAESMRFLPYLALEVTSLSSGGAVVLWIGEH